MQHEEPLPPSGRALVLLIEARDAVDQGGEELIVSGHVLMAGVRPVGKEGKVEMPFGVRQVVHLEPLDLLFDVGPAGEKRGHDDHGSKLRRHSLGELELGVQPGCNEKRHQAMDQGYRDLRGGRETQDSQQDEDREARPGGPGEEQEGRRAGRR